MVIQITVWILALFSGFVTIGRYGTWLTDINLLLIVILIRQMAAQVRRALAEECTVPLLLASYVIEDCSVISFEQKHNERDATLHVRRGV